MNVSFANTSENRTIAGRVIWFESPEKALSQAARFIAYACRYASHEDMKHIRAQLTEEQFRQALDQAPPGIIDARSWHYWNLKLGRTPPPPMPERQLEEAS